MAQAKKAKKAKKGKTGFQGNIQVVMLLRLLLVLVLFFFSRIFFYLFNLHYFSQIGFAELMKIFLYGIRFDISAILIINSPFIVFSSIPFRFREKTWYQRMLSFIFYLVNSFALMANLVDLIYFRFTLKRTTADIFKYLGVGGDFDKLVPQFLHDFWYVMMVWIIFIATLFWIGSKFRVQTGASKSKGGNASYYLLYSLLFAVVIGLSVIGIRGGLQLRPITIITAGAYTSAKNVPLLLNTPFSIAKTVGHESLQIKRFYPGETELSAVYTPVHKVMPGPARKDNVMILILESFSAEHIGAFNKDQDNGRYQGFTPFLDSLIGQSLAFKAFANGKTSIQGIPAVLSGIPSLMNESFIQSNYSTDKVQSLASLLKAKGYTSAFFHGGTNGTMGFDSYTRFSGFDHYYGRKEYHNDKDYDGEWGIRDEEFFQFAAGMIDKMPQPFMAAMFSLSSHHPYKVPGKYKNKFRSGKLPIQQAIMYSDYSLMKFFETAKKMPWFDHTLFVITADHTSEGYIPYYQTNAGQFAVPIIFYAAGGKLKGQPDRLAQQTDIMPSVLNYLGYDKDFLAFGSSVFDTTVTRFSIHYLSGIYGLIRNGYLLEFDGNRTTSLYDLKKDPLQKTDLSGRHLPVQEDLEKFIKAYIQQYNNRIIENRLTAD